MHGDRTSPLRNSSKQKLTDLEAFNRYKPIALQYLDRVSNENAEYFNSVKASEAAIAQRNQSPLRQKSAERSTGRQFLAGHEREM